MAVYDLAIGDNVLIDNELDAALQELDLLFNTTQTELLGNVNFGTNFEQFLWELLPSIDSLKQYIMEKIENTTYVSKMNVNVDINTMTGNYRDIYEIKIDIYSKNDIIPIKAQRVYQFR